MQEKERKQLEEVNAAREEATAAAEAFSVVRRDRQDVFCAAFEHVAGVIDGIFKGGGGSGALSFCVPSSCFLFSSTSLFAIFMAG